MFKLTPGNIVKAAIMGGISYWLTGVVIRNITAVSPVITLGGMMTPETAQMVAGGLTFASNLM